MITDYEIVAEAWDNLTQAYMEKAAAEKWNQQQLNQLHAEFKQQEQKLLQSYGWTVEEFEDVLNSKV